MVGEAKSFVESKFQYSLQYKLNYMIMDKCTQLSLKDFESSEMYDRIEKITGEISYRPYQIFLAIIGLLTSIVTMFSSAMILFLWNPQISLLLLIVPVISALYFLKIGQQEFLLMWGRAKDERKTWYLSHLLTHDFSFKEISLLNIKNYLLGRYWNISEEFMKQNVDILKKKTGFNTIYESTMQVISAIVIGGAIRSAYVGEILVGNVMSYIRSVGMVQSNATAIMSNIYVVYNSSLYMDMLFQFLKYSDNKLEKDNLSRKSICKSIEQIDIRNLSFAYQNNKKVLDNVNLTFKRGEKIALVGPNGSGKSTLLKILAGLYDIEDGDVLINGISIKDIDVDTYRKNMSVLFQDFVKYEMPLRENIGFGDVENIKDKSKMDEILNTLQMGYLKNSDKEYDYNMQLGNWFEEGRQLSQGQWQKIALGRAYFKEASFYILDEPNAALDTISEKEIFEHFFQVVEGKIGVFISHRLNAAKMADTIIVMDKGVVVGIGKHQQLLESCDVYKTLYAAENYGEEERSLVDVV